MSSYAIFGYYGQGNAGDEAILAALIDGINNMGSGDIVVYSGNPPSTRAIHKIRAYYYPTVRLKALLSAIRHGRLVAYLAAIFNLFRSDTFIVGGGGLFIDTVQTNIWLLNYLKMIQQAKDKGKKVIILGVSVGPLHHKESMLEIADAFNRVDAISVRDETSKALLIECGVAAARILVVPDLVFTLRAETIARIDDILTAEGAADEGHRSVALTPCCYNSNQSGWHEQYVALCQRAIVELDAVVWLIPMQRNANHDDLEAITNIRSSLPAHLRSQVRVFRGDYGPREIQGIIGRATFIVAERLHGSIMACNTNRPFMGIAYAPKVTGVLSQLGLSERVITMSDFLSGGSLDRIVRVISSYFENESAYPVTTSKVKKEAMLNFDLLASMSGRKNTRG